jgi:hypothetical protein
MNAELVRPYAIVGVVFRGLGYCEPLQGKVMHPDQLIFERKRVEYLEVATIR